MEGLDLRELDLEDVALQGSRDSPIILHRYEIVSFP